jgi:hypothetical protein
VWNRNYQRKRSAQEKRDRATIEGRIIEIVKTEPACHTSLTLYQALQGEGYPIRMVERAVEDLLRGHILMRRWQDLTLMLREEEDNPFARRLHDVEGQPEERRSTLLSELRRS